MANTGENIHEGHSMLSIGRFHSIALAIVAVWGIFTWVKGNDGDAASAAYLLLYVHMAFSIARGQMTGKLAWTWVLLVCVHVLSEAVAFAGYVLPTGQLGFQLTQHPVIGPFAGRFVDNMQTIGLNYSAAGLIVLLGIVGMNIGARFELTDDGRNMSKRVLSLGAVLVMIILSATTLFDSPAFLQSGQFTPQWYSLPYFAGLRSVPSKEGGLAIMFVMLVIPVLAVFIGRARTKGKRAFVLITRICAFGAFVGLGFSGTLPAEQSVLVASGVLVAIFIGHFVLAAIVTPNPGRAR